MRINKYLAECGVCSRRKADEYVKQGRVSVNKKVVREVGTDIDENADVVFVDGKKVVHITHYDYIMFNKPKRCVTTMDDSRDDKSGRRAAEQTDGEAKRPAAIEADTPKKPRKTVMDYLGDYKDKRLHTFGRSKEESDPAILRKGVVVDGVKFNRCKVKVTGVEDGDTRLEVVIFEGKNREIRRMFEAVEKNVVFLKRVAIGELRLGGLSRGGYRELNEAEIAYLAKLCGLDR